MTNDDALVAVHGTVAAPPSKERMEVRAVCFRIRQALSTLDHVARHGEVDVEHDGIRSDLEQVERVLSRWDPGSRRRG
ncbi:hypothetical protein [Nocardiopsis alba]|uniref:hypothetical protein n=1 Tax=Nocardiopsis alba TaxID=53437 RepID=UPI0033A3C701